MPVPAAKTEQPKSPAVVDRSAPLQNSRRVITPSSDNRPLAAAQRQLQALINDSPRLRQATAQQALIAQSPRQQATQLHAVGAAGPAAPGGQAVAAPAKPNTTGLPDGLKGGLESLSGYSLNDVRVHYNSAKPAQLQAHAYAQGTDIYVAPSQEKQLPHEAWHVVQQKQGRVQATRQIKGVGVNEASSLEQEADAMGAQSLQAAEYPTVAKPSGATKNQAAMALQRKAAVSHTSVLQRRFKKEDKEYSFLSTHDFDGNPYLSSKDEEGAKTWRLDLDQPTIELTQKDDLYQDSAGNEKAIYHNLSMGREQRVSVGGQKAILNPFKDYKFGVSKVPDIALFNVNEEGAVQKGKLYPNYLNHLNTIVNDFKQKGGDGVAQTSFADCKKSMLPLIMAEDYRTNGALLVFDNIWGSLITAFNKYEKAKTAADKKEASEESEKKMSGKNKRKARGEEQEVDMLYKELQNAIMNATSRLPWAGSGGKDNFRKDEAEVGKKDWKESTRSIGRRDVSPDRSDTGGVWEMRAVDEEEESPAMDEASEEKEEKEDRVTKKARTAAVQKEPVKKGGTRGRGKKKGSGKGRGRDRGRRQ